MTNEIKYWPDSSALIVSLEEEINERQQIIKYEKVKNFHNILMNLAPLGSIVKLGLRGGYISAHIDVSYIKVQSADGQNLMDQKPLGKDDDEDDEWQFRPVYLNDEYKALYEPIEDLLFNKKAQPHLLELVRSVDGEKGTDNNSREEYSFDYSITLEGSNRVMKFLLGDKLEEFLILEDKKTISAQIPENVLHDATKSGLDLKNKI